MSKKKISFAKPNFKDSSDRQLKEYFTEKLQIGYYDELKSELKELKSLKSSKESVKILHDGFFKCSGLMDSEALNIFLDVLGTEVIKYITSMKYLGVKNPALYNFFMCSYFYEKYNSEKFIKTLKIFLKIYGSDIVNILEKGQSGMVRYITKTKEINDDFKIALDQAQEEGKLKISDEDYSKIMQLITPDSPEAKEVSQESSDKSNASEETKSQDTSEDNTANQQSDACDIVIEVSKKPITTDLSSKSSSQNESVTKILQSIFGNLETLPIAIKNLIKDSEIYKTLEKFLESNNQLLNVLDNQTKYQQEKIEFIDQEDFASVSLELDLFSMLPDISTTLDTNLIGFIPTQMVSF